MRYTLLSLVCIVGLLQASLPADASGHSAKTLKFSSPEAGSSKAQCVQQILAYKGAISFLEGQLEKSPEAITYTSSTGKIIKVENRFRKQAMYNQVVLQAGLFSKMNDCRGALS